MAAPIKTEEKKEFVKFFFEIFYNINSRTLEPSQNGHYELNLPISPRIYTNLIDLEALQKQGYEIGFRPSDCFFDIFKMTSINERNPNEHFNKTSITLNYSQRGIINFTTYMVMGLGIIWVIWSIYKVDLNEEKRKKE